MSENLPREINRTSGGGQSRAVSYVAFVLFLIAALYPLIQIVRGAFSATNERGESLASVLDDPTFTRFLLTEIAVSLAVALAVVIIGWIVARVLSRSRARRSRGKAAASAAKMIAAPLVLLPLYATAVRLGDTSAQIATIVMSVAVALPFCIWQLQAFYDAIPVSVEEAALLDGCSRGQISRLILLPLLWPAIALSALFSFMSTWAIRTFLPLVGGAAFGTSRPAAAVADVAQQSAAGALLLVVPLLLALMLFAWRLRTLASAWDASAAAAARHPRLN